MLLGIIILKGAQKKKSKEERQSACMSPTSAAISIIEFQTIRGVLRKREAIESV